MQIVSLKPILYVNICGSDSRTKSLEMQSILQQKCNCKSTDTW